MFRKRRVSQDRLDGFQQLELWVREDFGLQATDITLVTEEKSRLPGYPETETHVVFWKGEDRYRLRLFKAAEEVVRADIPPLWLLPTLLDDGNFECC